MTRNHVRAKMIEYVLSLAKKHTDEIGFLPKATVEHYVRAGQVLLETENNEPCGFLIFGNGWPRLKIYQACIQYDAQRRAHGLALVGRVIALASERGCDAVSLWCADDLPANEFWRAAGFQMLRSKPVCTRAIVPFLSGATNRLRAPAPLAGWSSNWRRLYDHTGANPRPARCGSGTQPERCATSSTRSKSKKRHEQEASK